MTNENAGYDVLLLDNYFCDLIFTNVPAMPQLGTEIYASGFHMTPGGVYNTAVTLNRLGLSVGWACDFGNDFFSRFVLEEVRREGLDNSLFRNHSSPVRYVTVAISLPQDRAFVSYADDHEERPAVSLVEQHKPRCLIPPALRFSESDLQLYEAARRNGCLVYMECEYGSATLETPGVVDALCAVDIFAPNADEALHLTATESVEDALALLAELTSVVVIKLGRGGSIARVGGETVKVPAIDVEVFDTTGAGDCFNAGFLYGHLRGDTLENCLRYGNICGGLSTTAYGSSAVPTVEHLQWRVEHHQWEPT